MTSSSGSAVGVGSRVPEPPDRILGGDVTELDPSISTWSAFKPEANSLTEEKRLSLFFSRACRTTFELADVPSFPYRK